MNHATTAPSIQTLSAEACCRCRYWHPNAGSNHTGDCRRSTPTFLGADPVGCWPGTTWHEWCGEFDRGPYAALSPERRLEFWVLLNLGHPELDQ